MFWDEFGFSFQERLAPTWARKGKRPVFKRITYDRRALSTAVALTLSGKIYKRHFEGAMKSEQTIQALKHLQRHIPGKVILIWDRARIHTSKKVQDYLSKHPEICVELLPAYAPELNPEEYCHGNVKQHLRNVCPSDKHEMRSMLDKGFARLRERFLSSRVSLKNDQIQANLPDRPQVYRMAVDSGLFSSYPHGTSAKMGDVADY